MFNRTAVPLSTEYRTGSNCGHDPQLDVPERFSNDLMTFLDDPGRQEARFHPAHAAKGLKSLLGRRGNV